MCANHELIENASKTLRKRFENVSKRTSRTHPIAHRNRIEMHRKTHSKCIGQPHALRAHRKRSKMGSKTFPKVHRERIQKRIKTALNSFGNASRRFEHASKSASKAHALETHSKCIGDALRTHRKREKQSQHTIEKNI